MQAWELLFRNGIFTNVAIPPAVSPKRSMLRTSCMAIHTDAQVEKFVSQLRKVKDRIISTGEIIENEKVL